MARAQARYYLVGPTMAHGDGWEVWDRQAREPGRPAWRDGNEGVCIAGYFQRQAAEKLLGGLQAAQAAGDADELRRIKFEEGGFPL